MSEETKKKDLSAEDQEETTEVEAESDMPKEKSGSKSEAESKRKGKGKKKSVTHPRTLDMVTEAIEALKDANGSSVYAIQAYILSSYKTVRPDMLNHMLKQAFGQGLASGVLVRPKTQSETGVLNGSYKLGNKKNLSANDEEETTKDEPEAETKTKQAKTKAKPTSEKKGKKKSLMTHPRTLDMVIEALEALRDVKGSSVYAIKAYIISTYKTVRPDMLNHMLKQGFNQGLASGALVRPKTQSEVSVLSGSYKLGSEKEKLADRGTKSRRRKPVRRTFGTAVVTPVKKAVKKTTKKSTKRSTKKRGKK